MNYAMRYLCWKWINLENNLNDNSNILYFVVDRTFRCIESENSRFNYRGVLEVLVVPEKSVAGVPKPRFHYLVKKTKQNKTTCTTYIVYQTLISYHWFSLVCKFQLDSVQAGGPASTGQCAGIQPPNVHESHPGHFLVSSFLLSRAQHLNFSSLHQLAHLRPAPLEQSQQVALFALSLSFLQGNPKTLLVFFSSSSNFQWLASLVVTGLQDLLQTCMTHLQSTQLPFPIYLMIFLELDGFQLKLFRLRWYTALLWACWTLKNTP